METGRMIPIETAFPAVEQRVRRLGGDPQDLASWNRAFPNIGFTEIDDFFTGKPMEWDQRPESDKLVNAAMYTARRARVDYELEVDGHTIQHTVEDPERRWYLLFDGALRTTGEITQQPSEIALDTLFYYSTQGDTYAEFVRDQSPRVRLRRMNIAISEDVLDELER